MDIAQLIEQVSSIVNESAVAEALGADNTAKVKSSLRQIGTEFTEVRDNLSHANSESKNRKLKIREMEKEAEGFTDQIEDLKLKGNTEELETELKGLREFKTNTVKGLRDSFSKGFGAIAEHDNFSKAKNFFNLPLADAEGNFVKDSDGNFDFSKVSEADMETNISKLSEFSSVGLFDAADSGDTNDNKGDGSSNGRVDPKNEVEVIKKMTSMAELEAHVTD